MRKPTLFFCLAVVACNGGKGESSGSESEGSTGATSGTSTDDPTAGTSQSDTTPPPQTTTEADTSTATTEEVTGPGPTTAMTSTTEGDTTTTGSDSTTGDPGPPLAISLLDIVIGADCMPEIEPDNVSGAWTVLYDNTAGMADGSAELVSATLTLQGDVPLPFALEVEPTESGPVPAGETAMQQQSKQQGLVPVPGCSHCDKPYDLELVFKTGGEEVLIKTTDILGCTF